MQKHNLMICKKQASTRDKTPLALNGSAKFCKNKHYCSRLLGIQVFFVPLCFSGSSTSTTKPKITIITSFTKTAILCLHTVKHLCEKKENYLSHARPPRLMHQTVGAVFVQLHTGLVDLFAPAFVFTFTRKPSLTHLLLCNKTMRAPTACTPHSSQ